MIIIEKEDVTLNLKTGALCLDFANHCRVSNQKVEQLKTYSDLVAWARHTGIVTDEEAQHLIQEAVRFPGEATTVFQKAIDLRESIYRMFSAVASGRSPQEQDIAILNKVLSETLNHLQVIQSGGSFMWGWGGDMTALDCMIRPVAKSAANLLTSPEMIRVRECAADNCDWLFIDKSKNRSRQWCDMKICGNRAKVRRYYNRRSSSDT